MAKVTHQSIDSDLRGYGNIKTDLEKLNDVEMLLTQITQQNNNTISYDYNTDGSVKTVTEKDSQNNVIQTVNYTYNGSGDVTTSVTLKNGKTVTTTYNYDTNGNITSTVNVLS